MSGTATRGEACTGTDTGAAAGGATVSASAKRATAAASRLCCCCDSAGRGGSPDGRATTAFDEVSGI